MSEAIIHVLSKYRLVHHTELGKWAAKDKFLDQVGKFVSTNDPIRLILPAFPFKSPNKKSKVLGVLPDTGEEIALAHLNGLAAGIQDVYKPGAQIFIVSDGLMYNDILGVDDNEVWTYGQTLRQLAKDNSLDNLNFLSLHDLIDDDGLMSQKYYLENAKRFRDTVTSRYLPEKFDVDSEIASDPDAALTYRGYIKFLELDLAKDNSDETKSQVKKRQENVAKSMIRRGKAFALAIAAKHPNYVRLSIHASTEADKLSMSVVPQEGRFQTPWHSALVRAVNGTVHMAHASTVSALTHELIFVNGRPSHFRERSDLYNWPGMDLDFKYLYPTGIMISPKNGSQSPSLKDVPMQKVRKLSTDCSPVILRGFKDTLDNDVYTSKAYDLGKPAEWTFGIKTSVKDSRGSNPDPVTSIVTSNEAMPMHFDGFFFLIDKVQPDGTTKKVSSQPRYQYFTAVSPSTPGSGKTLFASSLLLFRNLPHPHKAEDLKRLTWDCRHSSNWDEHMKEIPLVAPHPDTGEDCLRYHEPWPQWKTKFTYNRISIENGPQWYIDLIDEMLYDRRVTLTFEWLQGDVLVSDNYKMLHTRTGFSGTEDRELWRIHVN
ncbi:Pyoverdine/dityrosine biosynthesis protein-domain-containing protein [Halenospora varia]|nr:Pyoverdine/dityrosine biosynthesis protein-domain-containing protein [Halenospora varia]